MAASVEGYEVLLPWSCSPASAWLSVLLTLNSVGFIERLQSFLKRLSQGKLIRFTVL